MTSKPRVYKLEYLGSAPNDPNAEPQWYEDRADLDEHVRWLRSFPLTSGRLQMRVTEYVFVRVSEA